MSENNARYFQWIVGERKNEVVIFENVEEDDGLVFITFKDGSRINEELVGELDAKTLDGKLMAEVESFDNLWKFKEKKVGAEKERWEENADGERVCVQLAVEGRTVVKLIPPKKSKSKFGAINPSNPKPIPATVTQQVAPVEEKNLNSSDPVYIMLDKAKKVDSEVNMTLTIALPSQNLFNVVLESFDEGGKKALDYIIDSLDIKMIKKELKAGIDSMYNHNEQTNYLGEPIAVEEPEISEPYIEKGGTGMPE